MTDITTGFSRSEDAGVEQMPADAKNIYSVGISTGGVAEMRMAQKLSGAHIVATTVDEKGVKFAQQRISEANLSDQIEAKLEDVAKPLAYTDEATISDALKAAGFTVQSVEQYAEQLFKDFMRTELSENVDNVIQVVATK